MIKDKLCEAWYIFRESSEPQIRQFCWFKSGSTESLHPPEKTGYEIHGHFLALFSSNEQKNLLNLSESQIA